MLYTSYDIVADVLYISLGTPVPSEGEGVPNGIELDYAIETGAPCGVTIIGYRQYEWSNHLDELGVIVERHLGVPSQEVESLVQVVAQ